MTNAQILFLFIVFASASMAAIIVISQTASNRMRKRLAIVSEESAFGERASKGAWLKSAIKLSGPFAKLSLPEGSWEKSPLRVRLMNAGYRGEGAPMLYLAAKTILAIGLPIITFILLQSWSFNLDMRSMTTILIITAALGYYLPNLVLAQLVEIRQRSIFENFPDATDLMLVCVEAGLGLDAGLHKVAEEITLKSQPLAEELQLVNLEMRAGNSRENSLRNLAMRTGIDEVKTFATMLVQADRFGTSIGDSLRVFSDELRTRRRFRAEELAAKIPIKLLFPLIFFIFPSLLLVLLGPAFIQVYRILLPTMSGQ